MKKILLIDDNKDLRENTAEILELANYSVLTARDGKEGIELAQNEMPDLIICDIMMPLLDGYGVLHLLSRDERTADIPFIFLTAKAERNEVRKGMEMGADDYLTKPFDEIELLNAIEARMKKTEAMQKNFPHDMKGVEDFLTVAGSFAELKEVSANRDIRTYQKKELIYQEDSYARGVFFVVKGKIKTFKTSEQGKELITGLYGENDFFGYHSLLENGRCTDSATALSTAEVCMIPKEDFFSLIFKNVQVSRSFIRLLSDNIREKEEQLVRLAYNSVRKRVAEAIMALYRRYHKGQAEPFSISISREDLASLAGTATETTIRTLSDFREESLVDVKGGTITVLDVDKLSRMKN